MNFKRFFIVFFLIKHMTPCLANIISDQEYYIIPIKFIKRSAFIKVEIEGKEREFCFDSGSNTPLVLSDKIAKKTKSLRYTGECKKYKDSTGKSYCQDAFILKKAMSEKYIAKNIAGRNYQP